MTEVVVNTSTATEPSVAGKLIADIEAGLKLIDHHDTLRRMIQRATANPDFYHPSAVAWAEEKLGQISSILGWVKSVEPEVVAAEPMIAAMNPVVGVAVTIGAPVVEEIAVVGQEVIAEEERFLTAVDTVAAPDPASVTPVVAGDTYQTPPVADPNGTQISGTAIHAPGEMPLPS